MTFVAHNLKLTLTQYDSFENTFPTSTTTQVGVTTSTISDHKLEEWVHNCPIMSLLYCAPQPPKCSQWFCYGPHYLGGQNDHHLTTIRTGGSTKCRHNGRQSARIDTIPVGRRSLICAHKEGAAGPSSAPKSVHDPGTDGTDTSSIAAISLP